jgi:hypothetical protein
VYFDVIVQISNDPDFITGVQTIFNNDMDNSAGLGVGMDMHYVDTHFGEIFDAKGLHGRYGLLCFQARQGRGGGGARDPACERQRQWTFALPNRLAVPQDLAADRDRCAGCRRRPARPAHGPAAGNQPVTAAAAW